MMALPAKLATMFSLVRAKQVAPGERGELLSIFAPNLKELQPIV